MPEVPCLDLKTQYAEIKDEVLPALAEVCASCRFVLGPFVEGFERDFAPILHVADAHGIPVVEDCAQAHGARYRGRRGGGLGRIGCFSFYPGKNLGAYGEGGAALRSGSSAGTAPGRPSLWVICGLSAPRAPLAISTTASPR